MVLCCRTVAFPLSPWWLIDMVAFEETGRRFSCEEKCELTRMKKKIEEVLVDAVTLSRMQQSMVLPKG